MYNTTIASDGRGEAPESIGYALVSEGLVTLDEFSRTHNISVQYDDKRAGYCSVCQRLPKGES